MRGLVNLGNTCYFNTAVQCLAHVPALTKHFFSTKMPNCQCRITKEFQITVIQLFLKDRKDPVHPGPLLDSFRNRFPEFRHGQHDAQEVIIHFIDLFEKSIGKEFIQKIFNGEGVQTVSWVGGESKLKTEFTTLILDVAEETTLHKLLEQRQIHTEIENYTDDSGKLHEKVKLQNHITQWPSALSFTFSMYDRKFPVEIPVEFEDHKLFACIIHQGIQHGGHYALLVRRYDTWYLKDDENVQEVPAPGPTIKGIFYQCWFRNSSS
jgi:ubiquitin C-terminal hydrolase